MMQRGANCRWKIDGVLYAVQNFRRGGRAQGINVSNSEGAPGNDVEADAVGFTSKIADVRDGQFQLVSASFDDEDNPFASPLALVEGTYHTLQQFPAGLSGPASSAFNALLVEVSHQGQIPGAQPVTLTFESDGEYDWPEEG